MGELDPNIKVLAPDRNRERIRRRPPAHASPNNTAIRDGIRRDLRDELARERTRARQRDAEIDPRETKAAREIGREKQERKDEPTRIERDIQLARRTRLASRAGAGVETNAESPTESPTSASTAPTARIESAPLPRPATTLAPTARIPVPTPNTSAPLPTTRPTLSTAVYTPSAFTPRPPKKYLPRAALGPVTPAAGSGGLVSVLRAKLSTPGPSAGSSTSAPSHSIFSAPTVSASISPPSEPRASTVSTIRIRTPHVPPSTSTIKLLQLAFEDTPPQLRELENGWRDVRRRLGVEVAELARREKEKEREEREEREKKQKETAKGKGKGKERGNGERGEMDLRRNDGDLGREVPRTKRRGKENEEGNVRTEGHHREREQASDTRAAPTPTSAPVRDDAPADVTKTLRWKEPLSTVSASYTVLTATAGLPTPPSSPQPDREHTTHPTPCPPERPRGSGECLEVLPAQPVIVQTVQVPGVNAAATKTSEARSKVPSQPSNLSKPGLPSQPSPPRPTAATRSKTSRPPSRPLLRSRIPSFTHSTPTDASKAKPPPSRLLAHPLPPTDPTTLKSGYTVTVHPPNSEFGLTFVLGRTVARVNSAGDEVVITGKRERTLRLGELDDEGRKMWATLAAVVAGLKRATPRIKIYGALGDMVLTCADPPDVVLTFVMPVAGETRVRIRYSLLMAEYVLETACRRDGETFKSRRVGRLVPPREASGQYTTLGIQPEDEWGAPEHEAVRRLWETRDEWRAYVLGKEIV